MDGAVGAARAGRSRLSQPSKTTTHGGSHTDGGLTVADLIAKVGGPVAERPRHHHAAPDAETADPEPPPPSDEQDDNYDAYALLSPAEYNYDLPDLDAIHRETVDRRCRRRADHRAAEDIGPAATRAPRRKARCRTR